MSRTLGLGHRPGMLVYSLLTLGVIFFALIIGLAIPILPWWFVVVMALLPMVIVASAAAPHLGLLFILLLIFEAVPSIFQPRVPFGGGQLKLYDLLILYMAAVVLLRALLLNLSITQLVGRFMWPLVYLFFWVGVSVIYAHFYMRNEIVLAEARNFIGWLLIPLIVLGIDSPSRYRIFVRGVLLIAVIVAVYVSIQSFFDIRIMTGARVERLDVTQHGDVTRSIAGGGTYLMVFALFYFINRVVERQLHPILGAAVILILITGLTVSFGRGVWLATGIGLIVSSFVHRGVRGAVQTTVLASAMLGVLLSGVALIKPQLAEAVIDRASGISTEVGSGGSYHWREIENAEAYKSIVNRPLLGVGLGGEYKRTRSAEGSFAIETTYIHNGYLYFPLKMGWLAVLTPLLLIVAFALSLRDCFLKDGALDKGFLAAAAGAFSVPVITSLTQPEWVVLQSIAALSVLISFALLYLRFGAMSDTKKIRGAGVP